MELTDYIANAIPITLLELCAALAGTFYISKVREDITARYFVIFLWFTVIAELFAAYAPIAYFWDYKFFGFIEDTPFARNYWVYNIYFLISYCLYSSYFKWQLVRARQRQIINVLLVVFLVSAIINLITSNVYFVAFSGFTNIIGSLLLLFSIALYYYQLLRSDEVLKIGSLLPFYISIGAIILHLCFTPFLIYSNYFKSEYNGYFVDAYLVVLRITNLLGYSIYIIGFIVCRKKKSLY